MSGVYYHPWYEYHLLIDKEGVRDDPIWYSHRSGGYEGEEEGCFAHHGWTMDLIKTELVRVDNFCPVPPLSVCGQCSRPIHLVLDYLCSDCRS